MAIYEIPEEIDAQLQQTADRLGRTKQDLLREAVVARLDEYSPEPDFTDAQIARFRRSIDQLDRGHGIPGEQIEKKMAEWRHKRFSH